MKSLEELSKAVVDKVKEISPRTNLTDMDIAAIAGITMLIMYEEDISNRLKKSDMNFREAYTNQTSKCCTLDRTRECDDTRVFTHEYVEWLENIIRGKK